MKQRRDKKPTETSKKSPQEASKKLQHFAKLRELERDYSMTAALILTERMSINAEIFLYSKELRQPVETYKEILNQLWNAISSKRNKLKNDSIQLKLEDLFELVDNDSIAAQSFRDFVVALGMCVDAFVDKDIQPAVEIAKLSQGDIERFLETQFSRELTPSEFREHELVQYELSVLDSLLDFFQHEAPDKNGLQDMRAVIDEMGVSNLGLSM